MEAVASIVIGAVLFMHAWQLFGLSHPKTTGLVGAVGAIALASLVVWKPVAILSVTKPPEAVAALFMAVSISVLVWAIYAALVAAVGLWDFDPRGLGLYSIFAAVAMIGQIIYCAATTYILSGLIGGIILAIAFGILFFHLAIPIVRLRLATAWVLIVVGVVGGVLGALTLFGLM